MTFLLLPIWRSRFLPVASCHVHRSYSCLKSPYFAACICLQVAHCVKYTLELRKSAGNPSFWVLQNRHFQSYLRFFSWKKKQFFYLNALSSLPHDFEPERCLATVFCRNNWTCRDEWPSGPLKTLEKSYRSWRKPCEMHPPFLGVSGQVLSI